MTVSSKERDFNVLIFERFVSAANFESSTIELNDTVKLNWTSNGSLLFLSKLGALRNISFEIK